MQTFTLDPQPSIRFDLLRAMYRWVASVSLERVRQIMCGGMCGGFVLLAHQLQVPVRRQELLDLGLPMNTHVVPEVYYAGDWHLLDPTWGVIFVENQHILSLDELLAQPDRGEMVKVTRWIWRGVIPVDLPQFRPVPPDWLDEIYGIGLPTIYRNLLQVARKVTHDD